MDGLFDGPSGTPEDRELNVRPIHGSAVSATVAEALREHLLSGALPPGAPLYDAALVTQLGAPRSAVREALAEVAREGLVVHTLHHGFEVMHTTREDVSDIYAVRQVFERTGLEALLGTRNVDLSWLRAATERMGEAAVARDWRAAVEADIAFHLAIVAAAGARRLTRAAQAALMELRLVLSVADRAADDLPALVADHDHLVAIFETGRLPWAAAALEDHLLRGEAVALTAVAPSDASPIWA
jgi:DNA-binding GntR family transcriptional regulator